jgi:hypothetical protein
VLKGLWERSAQSYLKSALAKESRLLQLRALSFYCIDPSPFFAGPDSVFQLELNVQMLNLELSRANLWKRLKL